MTTQFDSNLPEQKPGHSLDIAVLMVHVYLHESGLNKRKPLSIKIRGGDTISHVLGWNFCDTETEM